MKKRKIMSTFIFCFAVLGAVILGGLFTKYIILYGLGNDITVNEKIDADNPISINVEYTEMKKYAYNYILDNQWGKYLRKN